VEDAAAEEAAKDEVLVLRYSCWKRTISWCRLAHEARKSVSSEGGRGEELKWLKPTAAAALDAAVGETSAAAVPADSGESAPDAEVASA
jgi:hypothetical protein